MIDPGMEERSPEGWMLHDLKKMMKDLRKYQAEIKETLATADQVQALYDEMVETRTCVNQLLSKLEELENGKRHENPEQSV